MAEEEVGMVVGDISDDEVPGPSGVGERISSGSKRKRVRSVGGIDHLHEWRAKAGSLIKSVEALQAKVSKTEMANINKGIRDMEAVFLEVFLQLDRMETVMGERDKIDELLKEIIKGQVKPVQRDAVEAATVVEKKGQPPLRKASYAVVVRSAGSEPLSADEVKDKVIKDVRKEIGEIRVSAVRRVRNGIAIETKTVEDTRKLKNCAAFKTVGLKVDEPRKVGPKVVIYDVPEYLKVDELMKEMYTKNLSGIITEKEYKDRMRIISRAKETMVMEVPVKVRDFFVREGRVYLGWSGCRVREIDVVQRCFRCYGIGHMANGCSLKAEVCRKCGVEGHKGRDCKGEDSCRNCRIAGKPSAHAVFSRVCPFYVEAAKRARGRITED